VTAVSAKRALIDGVEVVVQPPAVGAEERAYWQDTRQESSAHMAHARGRLLALLHHSLHQRLYKKRTERAREIVQQLDQEGHVPLAHYAFDNGVLTLELTRYSEGVGQPWVSALESARHIQWQGHWRRVDEVAAVLRSEHPESVRVVRGRCRHGDRKHSWACTMVGRLQRYGRQRLVIVHEHAALTDTPRLLLTDAQPWESGRILETWRYRWSSELLHEFGQQGTGLEAAPGRKAEAVTRPCRLSGVAQSLLQRAPVSPSASERLACAQGVSTVGQKIRAITREA
jgi:hypothetical protein